MAKKILIAFDDSENSMRAVDFVAANFAPDCSVTLLNVLLDTQALCAMESPELTPYFKAEQSAFCSLEDKKKDLVSQAMQRARQDLVNCGFSKDRVEARTVIREKGIARDIIKEIQKGGYDLVVLGRQGLSGVKEFFLGSIPQKIIHGTKDVSVLLVG
ncbi:MAG: universal stress protein [Desulfobacterales bacterium]|nr:universal stress protein [Desulfobacterales bacterium]